MLLPIPLPDELFASMLARLGRLNGMGDLREVAERCFGLKVCPSFIDARLNLPEFCARWGDICDPVSLLEKLTTLGARRCLGEIDETAWRALVLGEAAISVGGLTFHGAVELRVCPYCRDEDIERGGVAYWHRAHQLPILHCCATHGVQLKKVLINRAALHQSFPLPGDFSDEREEDLPRVWSDRFEMELAVFSEEIFMKARPRQGLAGLALLDGLREQKLLKSEGILRANELFEFFAQRGCRIIQSEFYEECIALVRKISRSVREPARGMAFGRALVLCALFSNWRIVAERCRWLEALGVSVVSPTRDAIIQERNDLDVKEWHREKCLAYISTNPECSRLGFTRQNYRSFRWLLHHDRPWLDCRLPVPKQGMAQLSLF